MTNPVLICGTPEYLNEAMPVLVDEHGNLHVNISEPTSAFGDLRVAPLTPVAQVDFVYGLNSNLVTTTLVGSGSASSSNSLMVLSTTAAINSSATLVSKNYLKYRPGQGGMVRFTAIFTTPKAGSTQLAGVGNSVDGYFFGYNGLQFGILHRQNSVDTWYYQSAWNHEKFEATTPRYQIFDPTKGNVYQISFTYLGFGGVEFSIMNGVTNRWEVAHDLRYANTQTQTLVTNPSMPLMWQAANTSNNTAIVVKAGSGALFNEGVISRLGAIYGLENTKTGVGTTYTNILTIRNNTTINSITNRGQLKPTRFSASLEGTKVGSIVLVKNTTLGGSPSYVDVDATNSMTSYDVSGTTLTGGVQLFASSLARTSNIEINLNDFQMFLSPGETLTLAGKVSSTTADISTSITWVEDI